MKKKAFTLSEVLVTLVIIGVIAALTVPSFMNNSDSMEYKSSLKKAIAGANQALLLNYAIDKLCAQDFSSAEDLVSEVFKQRMSVIEGSDTFTSDDCSGSVFTTDDGIIFCVDNFYSDNSNNIGSACDFQITTPCTKSDGANLWIDVNGDRNPNKLTTTYKKPKDIYTAQIYSQKIVPYGSAAQQVMYNKSLNVE